MSNRWGNSRKSDRLYFLGLQNHFRWWLQWNYMTFTCSHEIKRCFLLERKAMTNLDSILKSRDITLPTRVHLVKAIIFPVVMYGCENWTINKAEPQRVDAFQLWCWRRLVIVPWTARRSNQSQFSSGQSLSRLWLFATPWIAACQTSLCITNSQSSLRLTSIESVMPSSHLILCHPLLLLPANPSQHQSLFRWVNSSQEVAKVLEFQF